ncbi:23S rRNA (uridine(2552)-2'-O)-methyltransferase [Candidatus Woesearchaeota archaeon]|nr:23S rRNA (uridine(2552)-2'-O)-methyltransferase [Candidatus Woesearchaeota archaeon]
MKPSQKKKEFFYRKAKKEKYRARSAYKLIELNKKYKLIKPGDIVLDCGAAPGSWSQVALDIVDKTGFVLAVDVLPVAPLQGPFKFLLADLNKKTTINKIKKSLPRKADIVMSDAAPEFSGIKERDAGLTLQLNKKILNITKEILKPKGNFICKSFQSSELNGFIDEVKQIFKLVKKSKPRASIKKSPEIYIIAKNKN